MLLSTVTIKPLFHYNKNHIGIYCSKNNTQLKKIKLLANRKFSKTHACWYIPYTKNAFHELKNSGIEYRIEKNPEPNKKTIQQPSKQLEEASINTNPVEKRKERKKSKIESSKIPNSGTEHLTNTLPNAAIEKKKAFRTPPLLISNIKRAVDIPNLNFLGTIIWNNRRFIIDIKYNKAEIEFIKGLEKPYWQKKTRKWFVLSTLNNLISIQKKWKYWNQETYSKIERIVKNVEKKETLTLSSFGQDDKKAMIQLKNGLYMVPFLKTLKNREFNKELNFWLIPNDAFIIQQIREKCQQELWELQDTRLAKSQQVHFSNDWENKKQYLLNKAPTICKPVIGRFLSCLIQKRYSWRTMQTYCSSLQKFMFTIDNFEIDTLQISEINRFLEDLAVRKLSISNLNRFINAIKFYFKHIVGLKEVSLDMIYRPKKQFSLPKVLSKGEIRKIFNQLENKKHTCMLYLAYGSGLRVGEIIKLKRNDICFERKQIFVEKGKGNRDRYVTLPSSIEALLLEYISVYKPSYWMFEGQKAGMPYSNSSLQKIVKRAVGLSGITKRITMHTFRHSFATHLHEAGTDIKLVQELLGHQDIKTTLIYLHVSNKSIQKLRSPLDNLGI